MRSNDRIYRMAIMLFVFAAVLAIIIWNDVSFAAILAFLATGFGCGITTGIWIARRRK